MKKKTTLKVGMIDREFVNDRYLHDLPHKFFVCISVLNSKNVNVSHWFDPKSFRS